MDGLPVRDEDDLSAEEILEAVDDPRVTISKTRGGNTFWWVFKSENYEDSRAATGECVFAKDAMAEAAVALRRLKIEEEG